MPFHQKTCNLLQHFEVALWLRCAATGEASSYCNGVGFWCLEIIGSDVLIWGRGNIPDESFKTQPMKHS